MARKNNRRQAPVPTNGETKQDRRDLPTYREARAMGKEAGWRLSTQDRINGEYRLNFVRRDGTPTTVCAR
jgi:hypothetical protein